MGFIRRLSDSSYEVRLTVPEGLIAVLNRKNLTRRLGTKSLAEAKRLAPPVIAQFQQILAEAEAPAPAGPPPLDIMAALKALDRWMALERQRLLPATFEAGRAGAPMLDFEWRLVWRRAGNDFFSGQILIDPDDQRLAEALRTAGMDVPAGYRAPASLREEFSRCCETLQQEVEATRRGSREHLDRLPRTAAPAPLASPAATTTGAALSEAFARWRDKRVRVGASAKTSAEFETQVKRFIDIHGDLALTEITRAHCVEFRDLMADYPAYLSAAERSQSIRSIVAAYRKKPNGAYRRLDAKTLNQKVFAGVSAVLNDAVRDGLIQQNPIAGISVRSDDRKVSRLPYSDDDVAKLFAGEVFRGVRVQAKDAAGPAAKWMPLLGAFTGARLEELAQLAVSDVKQEGEIWFIQVQERYDGVDPGYLRSLKNVSSRRKVPIHSALIGLGFLDFITQQRQAGVVHLFPQMLWDQAKKQDKSVKVSRKWCRWWAAYSRAALTAQGAAPSGPSKSFNSFRHGVKNRLRNASVEKTLRDAIMGHASSDVAEHYGRDEDGSGYELKVLAAAVEKLAYPGVDFDVIK